MYVLGDVVMESVLIKNGVKTENVQFLKRLNIVMSAMKSVEKGY